MDRESYSGPDRPRDLFSLEMAFFHDVENEPDSGVAGRYKRLGSTVPAKVKTKSQAG